MDLHGHLCQRIVFKAVHVLTFWVLFGFTVPAQAASDHFLKIVGIPGESTDAGHKDEIEIQDWNWLEKIEQVAGGRVAKASLEPFRLTARVSKASPRLMQACASGEHFKQAVLISRKAGQDRQDFLKVILSAIVISSYSIETATTDRSLLLDRIDITFEKIEFEYRESKADGTLGPVIKGEWEVGQGERR